MDAATATRTKKWGSATQHSLHAVKPEDTFAMDAVALLTRLLDVMGLHMNSLPCKKECHARSLPTYRSLYTVESEDDVGDGRRGSAHKPYGPPTARPSSAATEVEVVHLQLAALEDHKVADALAGVQVAVAELHSAHT